MNQGSNEGFAVLAQIGIDVLKLQARIPILGTIILLHELDIHSIGIAVWQLQMICDSVIAPIGIGIVWKAWISKMQLATTFLRTSC